MKKCKDCGNEFPETSEFFHKSKRHRGGFMKSCKKCENDRSKIRHSTPQSIAKRREYWAIYSEGNRERIKEKNRTYRERLGELANERKREWRRNNPDKEKATARRHYLRNKERQVVFTQQRRARLKKLESNFTKIDWDNCRKHFSGRCAYCGMNEGSAQDHFIPACKGGEYTINNIIPACKSCNSHKIYKDFFEWYPQQRFYSKRREQKILSYLNYKNNVQQLGLPI